VPQRVIDVASLAAAEIGIVGGSGFYELLDDAREVRVSTPFGLPSDPLVLGQPAGRRVTFVPRHGVGHRFPPHRVPYQANLWALRSVGLRQVIAPCTVGSPRADLDAGVEQGSGVTHEEVLRVFAAYLDRLRDLLVAVVADLPGDRDCPCPATLTGLALPLELP